MKEKIKKIFVINLVVYFFKLIYALLRFPFLRQDKGLRYYKNKHNGERCFIVATGPSLTIEDLELLKDEYTFSMNSIINSFSKTNWRPTYYVISDKIPYKNCRKNINRHDFEQIFFSKRIKHSQIPHIRLEYNNIPRAISQMKRNYANGIKPSANLDRYFNDSQTVVFMIIQLAMYMGFKKIYLIGQDCNFSKDKQHSLIANPNYKRRIPSDVGENLIQCFETYKNNIKNVEIYNCTRGGNLNVFPRINLEVVLGNTEK